MNFCRSWRRSLFGAAVACLALNSGFAAGTELSFDDWLVKLRHDAVDSGIAPETVDSALRDVHQLPRVLELDRRQPEFTVTLQEYLARAVNAGRVTRGKELMRENRGLLAAIAARYRVQPRFIVALWGIETDYGRSIGNFHILSSLATLAYDGRRTAYFYSELLAALKIIDQDKIDPDMMIGSWAGAMGQDQFMPSSYLRYAVDFDHDGRRDIWHSRADVLASAANYLADVGWRDDETWGRAVQVPANFNRAEADPAIEKPVVAWSAQGVRRADGGALPSKVGLKGSVIMPESDKPTAYLIYSNYRTILKWNRSNLFAIAVGTLADRLGDY